MPDIKVIGDKLTRNSAPALYAWPFPCEKSKYKVLWRYSSAVTIGSVGVFSKIWLCKFNNVKIYMDSALYKAVEDRPKNTALITISNHFSCMDDPLLWGCLRWRTLFQPSKLRWSLAAHDICFTNKLYGRFFALGKVVPVVRGEGIYQRGMDFVLDKLHRGDWLHIFPEGRVNINKEFIRLKWGIGRLVYECHKKVIVLPFYHVGMDDVLPNKRPYIPRIGRKVTILVGSPMEFGTSISKWKSKGWSVEKIRKEITNIVQDELENLKVKAYTLHNKRISS